jgi:hypothetical protein
MQELIIIRTNNSGKVKKVLKQERINFEIYQEGESSTKKISDKDLGKAYQEAWSNPQRYQEAQRWENAAVSDWAKRTKKDKK